MSFVCSVVWTNFEFKQTNSWLIRKATYTCIQRPKLTPREEKNANQLQYCDHKNVKSAIKFCRCIAFFIGLHLK